MCRGFVAAVFNCLREGCREGKLFLRLAGKKQDTANKVQQGKV